jgi:hypothetical protein
VKTLSLFRTCCAVGLLLAPIAHAQVGLNQITWGSERSPFKLKRFDCADEKTPVNLILIKGVIELIHPDDNNDPGGEPPQIFIKCPHFIFEKDSKLITRAALYIRGEGSVSGVVTIENTRGLAGDDGKSDPKIYEVVKKPNGSAGGKGGNGRDAQDTSGDYPLGRNAHPGGVGGSGQRGTDGGTGAEGSDGRNGATAADVQIRAGTYGGGTIVRITARGGKGGSGAQGGRGEDAGHGGDGGEGGEGGNAAAGRTAANGGQGGRGGDGGNGGNGGRGGDGGNGGNGGNATVAVIFNAEKPGNPPAEFFDELDGGRGGDPGIGGAPGEKGVGGKGGRGGCGGSGFLWHGGGRCGGEGPPGKDGEDGRPGPIGNPGKDGDRGKRGTGTLAIIVETKP